MIGTNEDPEADNAALAVGIRIEADATGEWSDLLTAARRHRLSRAAAAQVLSRYAMHIAERGGYDEADRLGLTPPSKVALPTIKPTPPNGSTHVGSELAAPGDQQ